MILLDNLAYVRAAGVLALILAFLFLLGLAFVLHSSATLVENSTGEVFALETCCAILCMSVRSPEPQRGGNLPFS
jgi:hypothetical protein